MTKYTDRVAGLILAGGRGTRLGGVDKALLEIAGERLDRRVARLLFAQCGPLFMALRDDQAIDLPSGVSPVFDPEAVVGDGPLVGVLSGMRAAGSMKGMTHLLVTPVDLPFLPSDLCQRLLEAAGDDGSAFAASGGRDHGLCALLPLAGLDRLEELVLKNGLRKVAALHHALSSVRVTYVAGSIDPFFNVNTPQDLALAEDLAQAS